MKKLAKKTIANSLSLMEELIVQARKRVAVGDPNERLVNYYANPEDPYSFGGWNMTRGQLRKKYDEVLKGVAQAREFLKGKTMAKKYVRMLPKLVPSKVNGKKVKWQHCPCIVKDGKVVPL